ncbi:hypothetical protein BJ741DRAFT_603070 [Chytriomyces cf. hyalinus JEL632]|nr:hypothetical protein BJ741DRAFT_603070 [Chytriomyces cf. hyalinus JEL632]
MNSAPQTSSDSTAIPTTQLAGSHTASARLAGIALKVMTTLLESNNHSFRTNNNKSILSNANSVQLRRLIGVFVSSSAKTSDQRAKGLPTTVLVALLFVSRIVRKAVSLSARVDEAVVLDKELMNVGVPTAIDALLRDPARLFLVGLMLAEASVSDAQTSTASWARLLNGGAEPAASECRKSIAQMKWAALEFLDHKVIISTSNFVQWCAIVRKWVGDGLVDPMSNTIPSTASPVFNPQPPSPSQQLVTPDTTPTTIPETVPHSRVLTAFANAVANIRGVTAAAAASGGGCLSMMLGGGPAPVPFTTSLGVFTSVPPGAQEFVQRYPGSCQSRGGASCGRSDSSVRFGQRLHPYQRSVAAGSGRGY